MLDPKEDGISHINIYSKGATELGRYLSNFADCHIDTEDGYFRTVEGYWYWLGCKDDRLRNLEGWACKKLGRELRVSDWNNDPSFEKKILRAIAEKIVSRPACVTWMVQSGTLPFFHYYTYGSKVIMPKEGLWMVDFITQFRDELVSQNG